MIIILFLYILTWSNNEGFKIVFFFYDSLARKKRRMAADTASSAGLMQDHLTLAACPAPCQKETHCDWCSVFLLPFFFLAKPFSGLVGASTVDQSARCLATYGRAGSADRCEVLPTVLGGQPKTVNVVLHPQTSRGRCVGGGSCNSPCKKPKNLTNDEESLHCKSF